tara:strand:- start:1430 stop:1684 length:255 start_codon:yes stop_codon:yes gene_type:complete
MASQLSIKENIVKKMYKVDMDIPGGKMVLFLRYFKIGKQRIDNNDHSYTSYMAGIGNRELTLTLTRRNNVKKKNTKQPDITAFA